MSRQFTAFSQHGAALGRRRLIESSGGGPDPDPDGPIIADLSQTPDSYRSGGKVILAGRGTSTSAQPWITGYQWTTSHGTLTGLGPTWMQPRLDLAGVAAGTNVTLTLQVTDLAGSVSPVATKTLNVTPAVAATHTFPQNGTNQATAIANAINALPTGGTIVLEAGASYNIQTMLNVSNKTNITVDGNGARLYKNNGTSTVNDTRVTQWSNCTNLTIKNLEIEGAYVGRTLTGPYEAATESGAGMVSLSCDGQVIENVYAHHHFGECHQMRRLGTDGDPNTGHIYRSWFDTGGRQGLAPTHGEDILWEDCNIRNARLKNWDPEPEFDNWIKRYTIRYCQFGPSGSLAWGANGRTYDAATGRAGAVLEDVLGEYNLFEVDMRWGRTLADPETGPLGKKIRRFTLRNNVALQQARDCSVTANNSVDCNDPVLRLQGVETLVVTGNRQVLPANGQPWLASTGSSPITNTGNQFT